MKSSLIKYLILAAVAACLAGCSNDSSGPLKPPETLGSAPALDPKKVASDKAAVGLKAGDPTSALAPVSNALVPIPK